MGQETAGERAQRLSAPTDRVLQVFEAFQQAPEEPLSLTNVVERTGLATSTCLGILNTLRRRGWLIRPGDDKTFVLGPSALAFGLAAQSPYVAVDLARGALRRLSARWECPGTASAVLDDHVSVLARVGPERAYEHGTAVGRRYPLRPPVGVLNLVWYPDDRIEQWLLAPHVAPVQRDRARLEAVVATARDRGYVVERWRQALDLEALAEALGSEQIRPQIAALLADYETTLGERAYVAAELDRSDVFQVASVSAPVYDDRGTPAVLLMLALLRDEMERGELERAGAEIRAVAAELTTRLGGYDPWA